MRGFRRLTRIFGQRTFDEELTKQLLGKNSLPSLQSSVDTHLNALRSGKDLKNTFATDIPTIDIAKKVLGANPITRVGQPKAMSFFEKQIFEQPSSSTHETASIPVLISDINDFPAYKQKYEAQAHKNVMLCVGGPAAEDQTVMAGVIDQVRARLDDIVYITRDYKESNVNHSAKQSHARHGNALNADDALSGHKLLPILLIRKLIGIDLEDVLEPDYVKIDVKFTIDPRKLRIYFGNELNWLKQELKKRKGELTEHDINRLESVLSQEILIALETQTGVSISGGLKKAQESSSSIHVNFSSEGEKHLKAESSDLARVGIASKKLSPEKHKFFFGDNPYIHSAYEYLGDGHVLFDAHQINEELAKNHGSTWLEDKQVERIFVKKNEQGNAEIVGIATKDGEFFYCNKLHMTGGYKVEYQFDPKSVERSQTGLLRGAVNKVEDVLGLSRPLTSGITTATGISINAIFKKSDRLKRIIAEHGSTGEIAVTNSHWTMIAEDDDHIVMRMTGGGNTGSEEYNPAYFLNVLANTRRIFGDDLIGILSTYGCPRAVNAINSTEFDTIAEGAVVSYGKGGTGNTKRHTEAAFGLMALGFQPEVVEHYNQFQTKHGKPLGDELSEAYKMAHDVKFFHDNIENTNRRMGYDKSISPEEMLAIGGFLTALSFGIYKGVIQEKSPDKSITR